MSDFYLLKFETEKLFIKCFLNRNGAGDGGANHGVVTHAYKAHHFNVCGNGGGAGKLGVGVHSAHGVGHAVGGGAGCHVVRVECTAGAAAGGNGEIVPAVFNTPFLVGACNGMLEPGGVGGVTGYGNAYVFKLHNFHAFGNIVGAIALYGSTGTVGEGGFGYHLNGLGDVVKFGFNVGKAVYTGNYVSGVFAKTVEYNS